ncbi:MAG TPA: TonB-dependent receptor [Candidatus Acidoferrales bacterium]|nr:TonB-dependent receptor [Candidatus Acidoferrales bacterium]
MEIRSQLPLHYSATLSLAAVATEILVSDSATLLDPSQTGTVYHLGSENLRDYPLSSPGRSLIDLINAQPGWLLEANGVLHPRGAEYDTQFVVDGVPVLDIRSTAFAPPLQVEELQSVNISTGGYPAEFGRKLGGVVEAVTRRPSVPGFHGKAALQGGSFSTAGGFFAGGYQKGANTVSFNLEGARTNRYLDPPVEENFSNDGSTLGGGASFERDLTASDRLRISVHSGRASFSVPNERLQQEAGRQTRKNEETSGQISYHHIFSPNLLASFQARVRDLSARLDSNPESTPIAPTQQRGFREGYFSASVAGHHRRHEWKAGGDAIAGSVHESFGYVITNSQFFDPSTPLTFVFAGGKHDLEQSAFVQDSMRFDRLTLSAGVRWDRYRFVVDENAISPRIGAAYHVRSAGIVLRASLDHIFQTPATENLLLTSSEAARGLNQTNALLRVRPARGNFYEFGLAKSIYARIRWNANYFRRGFRNFADDDLLLNTGVALPITFQHAAIYGAESKIEIASWGPVSGYFSYSYLVGKARLPVAGGLFLGDKATSLLNSTATIPISQDQRHTASIRIRYQLAARGWMAMSASYGTGLPIQLDNGVDLAALQQEFGVGILSRVNLDRGRVRPSFNLSGSAGYDLWKREQRSVRVQVDAFNLTNRLNVLNFAGVFSGTALAPGRSFALRLQTSF